MPANPSLRFCLLSLCSALPVHAQEGAAPPAASAAASAASAAAAASSASDPIAAAPAASPASAPGAAAAGWDGAIGLTGGLRPRYPGAPRRAFSASPAFFLRYGRLTITNASGFAPQRSEEVVRGLGLDVLRGDALRASLSLRYDGGRRENSTPAYAGLGNIRPTLRARLAASWALGGPWRLGASWNADVLGHGNGGVGDVSAGWERRLAPTTILNLSATLAVGDQRYMQAYYGITDMQAAGSVYPAYHASSGLRDIGVSANLRHDFWRDWTWLGNVGATRLLGPAAASPITRERNGWSLGGGLGWRF